MTIAELCLIAAVILTILSIAPAKLSGRGEYDNANPRDPRILHAGAAGQVAGCAPQRL